MANRQMRVGNGHALATPLSYHQFAGQYSRTMETICVGDWGGSQEADSNSEEKSGSCINPGGA